MLLLMGALGGGVAGLGAWLLAAAIRGEDHLPARLPTAEPRLSSWRGWPHRIPARWLGTAAVGLLIATATRLPALGLIVAVLGYVILENRAGMSVPQLTRLGDAVATWAEQIREGLDAGQHLRAAIAASTDHPPAELADPLQRLAARLRSAMPLPDALWALRAEVPHPTLGPVIIALDVAYRRGAGDLPRLMASQTAATREATALLRDQHALRARHRRAMTLLLALFTGAITVLLVAWPNFLAPYRNLQGQLALTVIGGGVVLAVRALAAMSRPPTTPDFFPAPVAVAGADRTSE
ncbi:type II secretion system F family protein [Parafrankia sp. EUN1f]|uniref:type II secretion system F family protein n=1 Tax=Parafrankia sp. EUN1f TaxID=102897 RepID=UPI0001C45FE5|nr:type II secretion system F family protein [Parafrankia sp. EUN1f]EFC81313.1 hypothetical protein FrEUN1fDRAFT_5560 [Parafrankia sp. EUN1f]